MNYKLVPLAGGTGTQVVEGKQAALKIADEIAKQERAHVVVSRLPSGQHVATAEPYGSLYDERFPAGLSPAGLPEWGRLAWWADKHARAGRSSALKIWFEEFADGKRI